MKTKVQNKKMMSLIKTKRNQISLLLKLIIKTSTSFVKSANMIRK